MKFVSIVIILVIFLSIGSSVRSANVDPAVINELNTREKANVVVKYKNNVDARTMDLVESSISKKRRSFSNDKFAAEINSNELNKLKNSPFIEKIYYNAPVYAFLDASAPLINATYTNNISINGIKLNGTGETICVLDTGIDFNNPALGGCTGAGCKVLGGVNTIIFGNDSFMDYHSHGTHVSGIIASMNNTYRGVAPGANLMAIKVLDDSGSGTSSSIEDGINWCVNNATKFNITVITMSLGGSPLFTAECTDFATNPWLEPISLAINNATRNNITVTIATGNDGSTTSIAWPACLPNATRIGSTTKLDAVSSFTNANSLMHFLAPGSSITSTVLSNSYGIKSGTSMATPHAAGAFALLHQYKRLEGISNATPYQILDALNKTGKPINDSGRSNIIFPTINILAALIYLDAVKPSLSISSPLNNSVVFYTNMSLNYSVSDNLFLDKCWYTNVTGSNISLPSCQNITFLAVSNQLNNITFYANDSKGNVNSSQIFFTVSDLIIINISEPRNITYNRNTSLGLNFTVLGNTDKIWYKLDSQANVTITGNTTFNVSEGNHIIIVSSNDTTGRLNQTNVSFFVDITYPNTSFYSMNNIFNASFVNVNYSVSDNSAVDSCKLEWKNQSNSVINISLQNCINITLSNLSAGTHDIKIWVNDTAGNINVSENKTFIIDLVNPSISIQNPENTTIVNTNITLNFTVSENVKIDKCWYVFNSSSIDLTSCQNTTFSSLLGSNTILVFVNDTAGNVNFSSVSFTVPTNALSLSSPLNASYNFNSSLNLNFTIRGGFNTDKIWYKLDNAVNVTIVGNSTFNVSEGNHILILSVNDTSGIINQTSVSFFIDVTKPNITLQSPLNKTYNISSININYTISDNLGIDSCRLEWYNQTSNLSNTSLSCLNRTLEILSNGLHRIKIHVNDSVNNVNSTEINFTIDTILPIINMASPRNASYASNNLSLNFTSSEQDQCWFILNANRTNLTSCQNTTFVAPIGDSNFTLYINDSAGNINSSFVLIFVDQTNPTLNLSSPTATTYTSTSVALTYNAGDNHQIDKCWYKLNSGSNTTLTNCNNVTLTGSSGSNLLIVAVNDTAGNYNETNITFTISLPAASSSSGGGGGGSSASSVSTNTKQTFTLTQNTKFAIPSINSLSRIDIEGYDKTSTLTVSTPDKIEKLIDRKTYSYVSINFTSNITSAKIKFIVNRSWIESNNLDSNKVILSHYKNGIWSDLETTRVFENSTVFEYKAVTDSFSLFAITALPKEIVVAKNETKVIENLTMQEINNTAVKNDTLVKIETNKDVDVIPFISLGVFLIVLIGVFIHRKK